MARATPKADRLVLSAPDRAAHGDAICDMLARVFSDRGGYERWRDLCRNAWILPGHYDWQTARVGLLGDRLVTHWGVWNRRMRIGSAAVRVAGVGGVATEGAYRGRGYMDRTAQAALSAMRDAGYHLSILFGIPDFYDRYGYVRAWPLVVYAVDLKDLPSVRPGVHLRRFEPVPRDDVDRLYNRTHRGLTGTAVRPTCAEGTLAANAEGYRWADADGRTRGYVVTEVQGDVFRCLEAAGDTDEVLRVLAHLARRGVFREVRLHTIHEQTPLMKRLRRGNCRAEIHYYRSCRAQVRLINLPAALEAMQDELARRLRASPLATWRGRLVVADARDAATLVINRSRVRVEPGGRSKHALRGGEEVAQLLLGTDAPEAVAEAAGTRLTGDARHLAAVLFPRQDPMMSLRDRY